MNETDVIGIGGIADGWMPYHGPDALGDSSILMNLFLRYPYKFCDGTVRPGFFFWYLYEGDKKLGVGRRALYARGDALVDIGFLIDMHKMPTETRRAYVSDLVYAGAKHLAKHIKKKRPEFEVEEYLFLVQKVLKEYRALPDPIGIDYFKALPR